MIIMMTAIAPTSTDRMFITLRMISVKLVLSVAQAAPVPDGLSKFKFEPLQRFPWISVVAVAARAGAAASIGKEKLKSKLIDKISVLNF